MAKKKRIKEAYQENGQFFALPHVVLDHPDYLSLSWTAQALLNHIGRFFTGKNNGDISIPESVMLSRRWSRASLNRGKKELIKANWIIKTRQGGRNKCDLFALSWKPLGNGFDKDKLDPGTYKQRDLKI